MIYSIKCHRSKPGARRGAFLVGLFIYPLIHTWRESQVVLTDMGNTNLQLPAILKPITLMKAAGKLNCADIAIGEERRLAEVNNLKLQF